ncbi:MAG TPA: ABC transporter substrate-binding protein, partial [Chloroflexota bacterium]
MPHATAKQRGLGGLVVAIFGVLVGCAPTAGPASTGTAPSAPVRVKTLVFATDAEPTLVVTGMGDRRFQQLRDAVHQHLAAYDDRGEALPQLALEIPTRVRGTWVIRPDGTMQTTYRLRPNVTWHDGAPLTAQDFIFGWTLTSDPALPIESKSSSTEIASIDSPDPSTLVIEWKGLYSQANAIVNDDLGPFASHLLKGPYEVDKQQMWNSPYWTTGFVGVGPFRLAEWRQGEQIRLEAYDGFFGGRPRIDQILIKFIPNQDTILANMLAGTVDKGIGKGGSKIQQQMYLKSEWERAGQKPSVFLSTSTFQHVWIQFREPAFPALTDLRIRKGLLLALDRQTLADALSDGLAPVAEAFLPPDDIRWDWVKDVVVKYPHDPR